MGRNAKQANFSTPVERVRAAAARRMAAAVHSEGLTRPGSVSGMAISYGDSASIMQPVTAFTPLPVQIGDGGMNDAFGRLRTSNPVTIFDSQLQYDLHRVYWEDSTSGSATVAHSANDATATMTVTASASDKATRQSREYFRYQPGKSHFVAMSFLFGGATAGLTRRVGYFDDDNGIFLEQDGTTQTSIVRRTKTSGSVVNNKVAQASWNVDTFSSTLPNPSGITLDATKTHILEIDCQWLGVGRVRVGFNVNGTFYPAHEFLNANSLTVPYMATANLPVRYEIESDGTNGGTMSAICSTVVSEGGIEQNRGEIYSAANGTTAISVSTIKPLVSIRPKATFNSIVNRGLILPHEASVYTATQAIFFQLVYGATLTSASWTSAGADSIVEYDVSATALTGGIYFGDEYTDKRLVEGIDARHHYPLALDISGSHPTSPYTDSLTLCATSLSTATNTYGALTWTEHR